MGSQREVGGEYLRMRMHLFEKCYMHAILHGLHAWHITGEEVQAVERVQSNYLKLILELPTSTPSAALFMETEAGICPATERIQYLTSLLYQNMMKRSGSTAATIVQAQQKSKTTSTMSDRMTAVIEYIKKTSKEIKEMQQSDLKKIESFGQNERLKKYYLKLSM